MKRRVTLTMGPKSNAMLARLARKLSMETNTAWDVQAVIVRCVNIGLTHSVTAYYPKEKVTDIGS